MYNLIVIGAGASGIISAITAAKDGKKVLLLEKLSKVASKIKATGGGRCNLSNTLSSNEFMSKFGKNGRFMTKALEVFSKDDLISFFSSIGLETHCPDGFRIFPITHNSQSVIDALVQEMYNLEVEVICSSKVTNINILNQNKKEVQVNDISYFTSNIIVASGGLGYSTLGADGDGYIWAKESGHKITSTYPAMMPLHTKERWVENCRADTIAKVEMYVDIKKYKKLKAVGDLIFTKSGIRGPVVLDFAREITPLFDKYEEIPLKMNLIKGKNENDIISLFKQNPTLNIKKCLQTILPLALIEQLAILCEVDTTIIFKKLEGVKKESFVKILVSTPLTISGHDGFKMAMITRGGVSLKDINPNTMQSKIVEGLYFCGEVMDVDGPCGGYNLQWSFSSGYLAGKLNK
ncbi:MAG TPA: NAD(P)/FAD-dependent oxidoreductase [Arcobacter sp.]|nr:NAD(P)/FAD-dependent oxidoreductase [Arcobacter sp.]